MAQRQLSSYQCDPQQTKEPDNDNILVRVFAVTPKNIAIVPKVYVTCRYIIQHDVRYKRILRTLPFDSLEKSEKGPSSETMFFQIPFHRHAPTAMDTWPAEIDAAATPRTDFGGVHFFLAVYACVSAAFLVPPNATLYAHRTALSLRSQQRKMAETDALFEELKTGLGRPQMSYLECFRAVHGQGGLGEAGELRMSRIVEDFNRRRPARPRAQVQEARGKLRDDFLVRHWALSLESMSKGRYYTLITSIFYHPERGHFGNNGTVLSVLLYIAFGCGWTPWSAAILALGSGLAACLGVLAQFHLALQASPDSPEPGDSMEAEIDYQLYTGKFCGASGVLCGFSTALPLLSPQARGLLLMPLWLLFFRSLGLEAYAFLQSRSDTRGVFRRILGQRLTGQHASFSHFSQAGHLAGAAFGLGFALVKLLLG